MKKDLIRFACVGLGGRGFNLMRHNLNKMPDVQITAVCDCFEDRVERARAHVVESGRPEPFATTDYREILKRDDVDAVLIASSWNMHIPLAIEFMKAGIRVAMEVGGCDNLEECWELVRTYRETGVECMLLENCCYGKREMMLLNMKKKGFFGEIAHVTGAYSHFLADEILTGAEKRHYRLQNYLNRNCENYPTHAFGPLCKLLDINRGNRLISLTSVSSKAIGLKAYMERHDMANKSLEGKEFMQGDIVTTIIRCAHGETIRLTLDTTLPNFGSRDQMICGTKARYDEKNHTIFEEGKHDPEGGCREFWGNADEYYEEYSHPLWKEYEGKGIRSGHGGMDWLTLRAFVESAKNDTKPPIDVYDAVAWLSIIPLSEASIAKGGAPVEIPDFTYGQWIEEKPDMPGKYSLDNIFVDEDTPIYPDEK